MKENKIRVCQQNAGSGSLKGENPTKMGDGHTPGLSTQDIQQIKPTITERPGQSNMNKEGVGKEWQNGSLEW